MYRRLFASLMVIFSIVIAVLGLSLPHTHLLAIIKITNFFDIMIPILAVTALINYLWKSCCCRQN